MSLTSAANMFPLAHHLSIHGMARVSCVLQGPSSVMFILRGVSTHGSRTGSSGSAGFRFLKASAVVRRFVGLEERIVPKISICDDNDGHTTGCIPFSVGRGPWNMGLQRHGEERKNESPSSSAPPHSQECRAQLPLDFPRAAAIAGPHGSSAVAGNDSEPEMISAASSPAQVAERKS